MKRNRARPGNHPGPEIARLEEFIRQLEEGRPLHELCRVSEVTHRPDGSIVAVTTDPASPGVVQVDQVSAEKVQAILSNRGRG